MSGPCCSGASGPSGVGTSGASGPKGDTGQSIVGPSGPQGNPGTAGGSGVSGPSGPSACDNAKGCAKAWCDVSSAGSNNASYNCNAPTVNGTGDYTLNWTTPFASANYAVVSTIFNTGAGEAVINIIGKAAGSTRLNTLTLTPALVNARFFAIANGDQ
jgi:hypothetical protein